MNNRGEQETLVFATPEVAAVYKALAALDGRERNALFGALTSEVKAGVWKMQLDVFLVEHDDLTADQRTVISDIASLIGPELYETREPADILTVNTAASTAHEIKQLIARAAIILAPDTIDRALYRLGPSFDKRNVPGRGWRLQSNGLCDCSTIYPTCTCQGGGCIKWKGCGPMGIDGCNGLCQ